MLKRNHRGTGSSTSTGSVLAIAFALLLTGSSCSGDEATSTGDPPQPPVVPATITSVESWDVCVLAGRAGPGGVYGSDLGITTEEPAVDGAASDSLRILFGDTWTSETSVCDYPPARNDDLLATLPKARPAHFEPGVPSEGASCDFLEKLPDVTDGFEPILLREPGPDAKVHALGSGRTPLAAFTDGVHPVALFTRGEPARCTSTAECPSGTHCTADPSYAGKPVGACPPVAEFNPDFDSPSLCLQDADCGTRRVCNPLDPGICVSQDPFFVNGPDGPVSPPWYRDDPRTGLVLRLSVAVALDPSEPHVYTIGAFVRTHLFANMTVRAVAHFDPLDPSQNDYRSGTETLLIWGRPDYSSRRGKIAPIYFAFQPLDGLVRDDGSVHWAPRFFAGYGDDGLPAWTDDQAEAAPLYGTDVVVTRGEDGLVFDWKAPEFDVVMQHSVSYVEPLGRFILVYGGSVAPWLRFDIAANTEIPAFYEQPHPGAIHYRQAAHPWGKATADSPAHEAWTDPLPLATPEDLAEHLACGDMDPLLEGCTPDRNPHRPLQLALAVAERPNLTEAEWPAVTSDCLDGTAGQTLQYNLSGDSRGNLYAPNVIQSWTDDVTDTVGNLAPNERAAEIYWNVSTWNPYEVVLVKSRLRARKAE